MSKQELETAFGDDFDDPGSLKSGEHLAARVLRTAKRFAEKDRSSLVEVLDEWLRERSEPRTMLAVTVAGGLRLVELRNALLQLKQDINSGRAFIRFCGRNVDAALHQIEPDVRTG